MATRVAKLKSKPVEVPLMRIYKSAAQRLCEAIIRSIVTWQALEAALQSGGVEQKARGRFANAVESWLRVEGMPFLVLPEYAAGREP
jgi:hypothetical protein